VGSNGALAGYRLSECEPKEWFVVFSEDSPKWWVRWLAWGRFKHVSVFGKVERSGAWVFYDVWLNRAQIMVVGDWEADAAIGYYASQGVIVRFPRLLADDHELSLRPGLWCVPAVAHILGIRSCALRPDRLFRQILAKGGQIVSSKGREDETEDRKRSGIGTPEAAGGGREGQRHPRPAIDAD
jgi:hypothetical protein